MMVMDSEKGREVLTPGAGLSRIGPEYYTDSAEVPKGRQAPPAILRGHSLATRDTEKTKL